MTLVVSEVSKYGIAMAADSAITEVYPSSYELFSGRQTPPTVRIGAQKIIPIAKLNSAISVWGIGSVGTPDNPEAQIPVDRFLVDFVELVDENESLEDIGNRLANTINSRIRVGEIRGGFHLAGFSKQGDILFPALYHIHTGPNPNGPHEPMRLHLDYPFRSGRSVPQWIQELETTTFWLRNGLFDTYAYFSDYLNRLMERLKRETNFICPDYERFSSPLEARGRFLKLQIQTICEFYRLSNRLETIAMPISWITISEEGIQNFEPIVI